MSGPESFFEEKLAELDDFLVDPDRPVMRLIVDPEMKRVPLRYLERREESDSFRHLLFGHDASYDNHLHWNEAMLAMFDGQLREHASDLEEAGADYRDGPGDHELAAEPWRLFLRKSERLAESLKDIVDSLVFVIDPENVSENKLWQGNIRFFAEQTRAERVKFIVLDERQEPLLESLEEHPKVFNQLFWLSPEEIEKRAEEQLNPSRSVGAMSAETDPGARRRALATVGIMANARKDHARAEEAQRQHVEEAKRGGQPTEIALALYNLGKTYIDAERPEEAVEVLLQAADGCCYHELDGLAPMVYTNLGIALHRCNEHDHALDSLRVARDMFRAQRNVPGEAYVCDCLAQLHNEVDKRDDAQAAWEYALSLYDGITNPAMEDVRESGREDILARMKHYGYEHAG